MGLYNIVDAEFRFRVRWEKSRDLKSQSLGKRERYKQ